MPIEMEMSDETILEVWREWEAKNPGKVARRDMTSAEFADAMMEKMIGSASRVAEH